MYFDSFFLIEYLSLLLTFLCKLCDILCYGIFCRSHRQQYLCGTCLLLHCYFDCLELRLSLHLHLLLVEGIAPQSNSWGLTLCSLLGYCKMEWPVASLPTPQPSTPVPRELDLSKETALRCGVGEAVACYCETVDRAGALKYF